MKRKRHTPQEIVAKLREADVDLNQGATIEVVCRKLEISKLTFHRWRHPVWLDEGPVIARMKELENENARLNKIVAQQAMEIDALKDLSRKTGKPGGQATGGGAFARRMVLHGTERLPVWRGYILAELNYQGG
jgi:putative transposase